MKKTYDKAFKEIAIRLDGDKPKMLMSDFELGAINAAKQAFGKPKIKGCFFHLEKNIWAHIQSIGLQSKYVSDPVFALNVRQLMALPFIPASDIPGAFEQMCKTEFWMPDEDNEYSVQLQELLNYFETTYIGILTRTQSARRGVQFPPELWSVYDNVKLGMPRTNNGIESWHGKLQKSFGGCHLSIYKFFEALSTEQGYQQSRLSKIERGENPEPIPASVAKLERRIEKIVNTYQSDDSFDVVHYLTRLAHNIGVTQK